MNTAFERLRSCAAKRAYQVGLPSAVKWSVSGNTRQLTQSRSSVESPSDVAGRAAPAIALTRSSRSRSTGTACLRSIARIKPGEAEVRANPRSRSAVMRVAERTEVPL